MRCSPTAVGAALTAQLPLGESVSEQYAAGGSLIARSGDAVAKNALPSRKARAAAASDEGVRPAHSLPTGDDCEGSSRVTKASLSGLKIGSSPNPVASSVASSSGTPAHKEKPLCRIRVTGFALSAEVGSPG